MRAAFVQDDKAASWQGFGLLLPILSSHLIPLQRRDGLFLAQA